MAVGDCNTFPEGNPVFAIVVGIKEEAEPAGVGVEGLNIVAGRVNVPPKSPLRIEATSEFI